MELAFVIPLVLLFLFAIIDFGLALNAQNSDTNVANIVARTASVIGTSTSETCGGTTYTPLNGALQAWAQCMATTDGETKPSYVCVADVQAATPSSSYATGDPVKVEVQSTFNWFGLIGASGGVIGNATSTIGASATMRVEDAVGTGSTTTNPFLTPTCSS